MSEQKKRGRPTGSKTKNPKPRGKAENIYFKKPCWDALARLTDSGLHGSTHSEVVCKLVREAAANLPTSK